MQLTYIDMAMFSFVIYVIANDGYPFVVTPKQEFISSEYSELVYEAQKRIAIEMTSNYDLAPVVRQENEINVETTNVTVVLENIQLGGGDESNAPWMYNYKYDWFNETESNNTGRFAYTKISWNSDGAGNGTCQSNGSGRTSGGYLDLLNFFLGPELDIDFSEVKAELGNLSLSQFSHINTADANLPWNETGAAGDSRHYTNGVFIISDTNQSLLLAENVQFFQNTSYPQPIGESPTDRSYVSGYFIGEINEVRSDDEWVQQVDPNGTGFILGILTAFSTGPRACYSSASYWFSVRGFPKLEKKLTGIEATGDYGNSRGGGAKIGFYNGSDEQSIQRAITLSTVTSTTVNTIVSSCAIGAAGSAGITALAPSTTAAIGTPSTGAFRMIKNAAFIAKISEIYGFHTDAMNEFGSGLKIFVGKVKFPFSSSSSDARSRRRRNELGQSSIRQEEESEVTVTDELFNGCAFYTTVIVVVFLSFHFCIWLLTRRKPLLQQITAHGWMLYLFSIVMSFVHTASIVNSVQYIRSHAGKGTGKAGLYVIAVLQLVVIGIGFTAFFVTITILALIRIKTEKVKWIPRNKLADPKQRRSFIISGEYQAEDDNIFHNLFQSYYASLAGPRLWLAGVELTIQFFDAIFTAVIWNEVICLATLVSLYAILFLLFLLFAPFVDKIEGRLVTSLGLIDLLLLIIEFMGALGDFETAERMENIGVVVGSLSLAMGVIIAIYCDVIPMMGTIWSGIRRKMCAVGEDTTLTGDTSSSDWSGMSTRIDGEIGVEELRENEDENLSWSNDDDDDERRNRNPLRILRGLIGRNSRLTRNGDEERGFFFYRRNEIDELPAQGTETVQWPMIGQIVYTSNTAITKGDSD